MLQVNAQIDGRDVVTSGSLLISDDHGCSIEISGFIFEFRFVIDTENKETGAKWNKISEGVIRYTLTNWGRSGTTTTAELERIITIDDLDYNISFSVMTISGESISRIFLYTVWVAGVAENAQD